MAWTMAKPPLLLLTRRDWRGAHHLPRTGGVIIVANHFSHADPLLVAHFVYDAGRWPRFLAKDSIFRVPVVGTLMRRVEQIPVRRGSADAARALDAAVAAVAAGEAVIIYPEGTTTNDPDLWPMRGKTGVARLWLATGVPVIPVAVWGAQRIFDPRTRRLRLRPRTPVAVTAGPPIDLSGYRGVEATGAALTAITELVMDQVTGLLAGLRSEPRPRRVPVGERGREQP